MRTSNKIQGFTLIELMIVVAFIAILLLLATPSIRVYLENSKVRNVAESIAAGMQKARAHAINRGMPTEIFINTNAAAGFWTINELDTTTTPPAPTLVETFTWGPNGHNWGSIQINNVALVDSSANATPRVTFNSIGRIMSSNLLAPTSPLLRLDVGRTPAMNGVLPLRVEAGAARGIRVCAPHLDGRTPPDPKACS
ncbi:MAG: GspH/FimT family pseudopilin [Burkholderiales bacterium]|jgi:type IV fimbrial biogenesis protein FimT|nr:GspH/FimT family pseudopilin [Burkholderiales bacterium]